MTITTYETYQESGIQWLGEIPKHWEIKRLKDISNLQFSNVDKKTKEGQKDVYLCNYVDVYKNDFITNDFDFMLSTASDIEIKKFTLRKGDILATKDSETANDIANPAIVTDDLINVICGYHLAFIRTEASSLNPKYLFRLFQSISYNFWFSISAKGITRVGLSISAFNDSKTPLPTLSEQAAIGTYLDANTAAIDKKAALLAQKIGYYKELSKSLINETVCRGLDKNAPLKDSGIEWIGLIPEHWEVKRFKDVNDIRRGASPRPIDDPIYFDDNGEFSWVRIADLTASERYLETTKEKLSDLGASLSVKRYPNDFILSIAGTVGKPMITKIKCCIHDGFVWFPNLKLNPEFLYYMFTTGLPYQGLGKLGTQLNLNTETIGLISLPLPPKDEIEKIVNYLDTEIGKINSIIHNLSLQIARLKELRKTLINDVVTGKVKVI